MAGDRGGVPSRHTRIIARRAHHDTHTHTRTLICILYLAFAFGGGGGGFGVNPKNTTHQKTKKTQARSLRQQTAQNSTSISPYPLLLTPNYS